MSLSINPVLGPIAQTALQNKFEELQVEVEAVERRVDESDDAAHPASRRAAAHQVAGQRARPALVARPRLADQGRPDPLLRLAGPELQTARAAARPAVRPEKRQPPRKVPSRAL